MELEEFQRLPDSVDSGKLLGFWEALLSRSSAGDQNDDQTMECICELADRQWHSYQVLHVEMQERVEDWIFGHWASTSLEFVTAALFVLGALGSSRGVEFLRTVECGENVEIREAIDEALKELEESKGDPYRRLRAQVEAQRDSKEE